ncbi:DUF5988 family protein [Amycolatopsis sp. NPDC049868]|uniref:DUF5988 family protein n=1 Tax=Amycolatopsis sp. NPDC049868 TaxID=3363934 RepID=UPI0037A13B17
MGSIEPDVKVTLKGAPDGMPETVFVTVAELSRDHLKIPFRAGYEHFTRDGAPETADVFVWCDRTKVAE